MNPVTLGALVVLLVNDLMFKALWPGAWVPGKLSDLAWMIFAPPVLAYVLSFTTLGRASAQRVAFITAYVGLPLLYVAFNTFAPVHDVVLQVLGWVGGEGPRSPLDPTDSIVIPFAMAALASVASSYDADRGVDNVGRTASGKLGTNIFGGFYESMDGGMTWTKTSEDYVPFEKLQLMELEGSDPAGIFSSGRIRITNIALLSSGKVVYSFEYLQSGGNRWMQAIDKRGIQERAIATVPSDFFYDNQSGNLILAMGIQGVVAIAPDGTATQVAVGRYSPTDFSLWNKTRTFFNSLAYWGATVLNTLVAFLLAFSFAALALTASARSEWTGWARIYLALAAGVSAFLAISVGVYPRESEHPMEGQSGWGFIGYIVLLASGLGLLPFLMAVSGLVLVRTNRGRLLAVVAATAGMLLLILFGALVLFEMGPFIANFAAVALVGLAAFGLWAFEKRRRGA